MRDLDFEVTKIEQLVKHPESKVPLTSAFDNKNSSIRDKIQALLTTGKLEKLDILKQDKRVAALLKLGKIWGVGKEGPFPITTVRLCDCPYETDTFGFYNQARSPRASFTSGGSILLKNCRHRSFWRTRERLRGKV